MKKLYPTVFNEQANFVFNGKGAFYLNGTESFYLNGTLFRFTRRKRVPLAGL